MLFFIFLPYLYFFNSIFYRFVIARILSVLPENFRDWGGCPPPSAPPLVPLRPIVSSIGAYNYNLDKYLNSLITPLLPSKYSVKDSFSFVEELRSFDFNKFLISFDVDVK